MSHIKWMTIHHYEHTTVQKEDGRDIHSFIIGTGTDQRALGESQSNIEGCKFVVDSSRLLLETNFSLAVSTQSLARIKNRRGFFQYLPSFLKIKRDNSLLDIKFIVGKWDQEEKELQDLKGKTIFK